jgi:hypothetical protein
MWPIHQPLGTILRTVHFDSIVDAERSHPKQRKRRASASVTLDRHHKQADRNAPLFSPCSTPAHLLAAESEELKQQESFDP